MIEMKEKRLKTSLRVHFSPTQNTHTLTHFTTRLNFERVVVIHRFVCMSYFRHYFLFS